MDVYMASICIATLNLLSIGSKFCHRGRLRQPGLKNRLAFLFQVISRFIVIRVLVWSGQAPTSLMKPLLYLLTPQRRNRIDQGGFDRLKTYCEKCY